MCLWLLVRLLVIKQSVTGAYLMPLGCIQKQNGKRYLINSAENACAVESQKLKPNLSGLPKTT